MLQRFVEAGIWGLFQLPVVDSLARLTCSKAAALFKEKFIFSSQELETTLQESAREALVAIASGIRLPPRQRSRLNEIVSAAFKKQVAKEFEDALYENYLKPFAADNSLSGPRLGAFYQMTRTQCLSLSEGIALWFPRGEVAPVNWVTLLQSRETPQLTTFLIEDIKKNFLPEHEDTLLFLQYKELLGDAILYFFQEALRRDERVRLTTETLQREGIWSDLREVKDLQGHCKEILELQANQLSQQIGTLQSQQDTNRQQLLTAISENQYHIVSKLGEESEQLQQRINSIEEQLAAIPEHRKEIQKAWSETSSYLQRFDRRLQGWCDVVSVHLGDILEEMKVFQEEMNRTREAAESARDQAVKNYGKLGDVVDQLERMETALKENGQIWQMLLQMMHHYNLSRRIEAKNEFISLEKNSVQLIHKAAEALEQLPPDDETSQLAAINVGSVLSSLGHEGLEQSFTLLQQATKQASTLEAKALAYYNLFHVHLRQKQYAEAKEALQQACLLQPDLYALHDIERYPIERVLGAGGMGCAFLCSDHLHGKVVVKTFWDAEEGPIEEVFAEAIKMRQLGTEFFPVPLDFRYTLPLKRERPFFVMEYVDGAMDGEAWLARHGALSEEDGMQVACELAKAIKIAHDIGICHFDLKPANLLLKREPGASRIQIKVIDFGLAQAGHNLRDEASRHTLTQKSLLAREIFGTRYYASPEQRGEIADVAPGFLSDVYSYGATLYRLLTKKLPSSLHPAELPQGVLSELVLECTQQEPKKRPASMDDILVMLEDAISGTSTASVADFRQFLNELETDAQHYEPGSKEIQQGCVELYGYSFQQLTEECLAKNRIILLQGRRGTGKTFLLRRLLGAVQQKVDPNWLGVQHSFDEEFLSRMSGDMLRTVLGLTLWQTTREALAEHRGTIPETLSDLDEELVDGLFTVLRDNPKADRKEIRDGLFEQFVLDEQDRQEQHRILRFLREVVNGRSIWNNIASMLKKEKIRQIHFFLDEFVESSPDPESHQNFFQVLKQIKKSLQGRHRLDITIVSSIYPVVTNLAYFIPKHDGELLDLSFRGSYVDWHKKVTEHLLAQHLNIFLQQHNQNELTRDEYITLRNRVFEGKAIKRLSYLSARNPRIYIGMLRRCQALTSEDQRITLHTVEQVAENIRRDMLQDIHRFSMRFPQLKTNGERTILVFSELKKLWKSLILQRARSGQAQSLRLQWNTADLHAIGHEVNLLIFVGILHREEYADCTLLDLDLLYALPDIITDGDVENLEGVIDVDKAVIEQVQPSLASLLWPRTAIEHDDEPDDELDAETETDNQEIQNSAETSPTPADKVDASKKDNDLANATSTSKPSKEPAVWTLDELLELQIGDPRLKVAKTLLRWKGIRRKQLRELVYYSRRNERFQVHDTMVDGETPSKELKNALVAAISVFLESEQIQLVVEPAEDKDKLLNMSIDVLELPEDLTDKLKRKDFTRLRDLLFYREKGDKHYYHSRKVASCKLNRRELNRLSRTVKVFMQQHDID